MVLVAVSEKSRKRKIRIIITTTLLSLLLAAIVTLFILFVYHVNSLETIYPNVWNEGLDMTGLTYDQAVQALIDSGYEASASEVSVTVLFPYDLSFTITGDDVGLTLNAAEAVQTAYDFGRDGTFLQRGVAYIRASLSITELSELNLLNLDNYDNTIIHELAQEYTLLFNEMLYDNSLEVSDRQITVTKGSGYAAATFEEIFNLTELSMNEAIKQHKHLEVTFIPESNRDDSIDLLSIYNYIHEDAVSSYYDPDIGNPKSINYDPENMGATISKDGKSFDLVDAERRLREAQNGETIIIPIYVLEPEMSQEEVKSLLYRDLLGECQAWQSSASSRAGNIKLASEAINGLILQPGDIFSFNAVVGERTEEKGYREANAIMSGVLVPELGGGVCQVSSAIYAAVLQTDLEIVSRTPHGLRVGYLPAGQDATVSWGTLDFRFKNNYNYPIRLEAVTSGSVTVTVRIYGTRESEVYYKIVSEELEDESPIELVIVERPFKPEDGIDLAPGGRHTLVAGNEGSKWEVWKYHYSDPDFDNPDNMILDSNGNQVRTLANKSTYPMNQRVIIYNPEEQTPPPPPPTPDPTPDLTPDTTPDPAAVPTPVEPAG